MRRVVIIQWKRAPTKSFEIFSNLKIFCQSYPVYNYNTLNNYLSKGKIPFENSDVRIERSMVQAVAKPSRQIAMVAKKVKMRTNDEVEQNLAFWLSRPVSERLEAVTRLSGQLKGSPDERMDKTMYFKRKPR